MKYWIWLQSVLGIANSFAGKLISDGLDASYIYHNFQKENLFSESEYKKAIKTDIKDSEKILKKCSENGIKIICPYDKEYPKVLFNIPDPPLVLYYKGILPDFNSLPSLCIVGPRKVSLFGYKCAYSLSARFSISGFIIVSGGAVGCDYAAHDGALVHGGKTVAVLGNGLCFDYLKKNEQLRKRILEKGCLITEFPPDTPASKFTFPKRNRIMAALTLGTVLIEAPRRSGALITAGYAEEYNKDLFVIPGKPGSLYYEGSNLLLRDGAKPLCELSDVFGEYLWAFPDKINVEKAYNTDLIKPDLSILNSKNNAKTTIANKTESKENPERNEISVKNKKILSESLSKNAKIVYNQLDKPIFICDDLISENLSAGEITSALGELLIYGYIEALPGGRYSLK